MLVGSFIAFFDLLNHDDPDAILDIEEDAPIADAHPIAVLMTGQSLYVPAIRPVPERFHHIVDLLAGLPTPDFVKLPIGFGSPVDAVHELIYKFKISIRQANNRDRTDRLVEIGAQSNVTCSSLTNRTAS
jgi:hypothetical protein